MNSEKRNLKVRKDGGITLKTWLKVLFFVHLSIYISVNGFLAFINFFTWNGYLWFVWPLFAWGFGVMIHGGVTLTIIYFNSTSRDEKSNFME